MFESPKSEQHYWKFRAWSTTAYDTKSLLEEESEYFHIEVMQKNLQHALAVTFRKIAVFVIPCQGLTQDIVRHFVNWPCVMGYAVKVFAQLTLKKIIRNLVHD